MTSPYGFSEICELYAAGLARKDLLPRAENLTRLQQRRAQLVQELRTAGIKGWPERGTYFTRSLPNGCAGCLAGRGSNVCVTTRCNRNCFFCFNPLPRADNLSVHGHAVASPEDAVSLLRERNILSIGISGGEPLLSPERTLSLLRSLRSGLGRPRRIDLYSNGDALSPEIARRLIEEGLDGVRLNLVANGFNTLPVRTALEAGLDVDVEIPVIPGQEFRLEQLIEELDAIGAPHLILHELFVCAQNFDEMKRLEYRAADGEENARLAWSPVAGSYEAALELLLFSLQRTKNLSVYFCSCSTQSWIAENALALNRSPASS